jgi:hypothetical protein
MKWLRDMLSQLEAEQTQRNAWVNELAAKYGIIRMEASLTQAEAEAQKDRLSRALGLKFLTTEPYPFPPTQISFLCSMYGRRPHAPCSGTTDDGFEKPCLHWCHQQA